MSAVLDALAAALALAALPGAALLLALTLAACRRVPRAPTERAADAPARRLAVVVPAHDEQDGIAACVAGLAAAADHARAQRVDVDLVVVADNCTDATAERARAAGARVIERIDATARGKGHALALAFDDVLARGAEAVLVVDADTRVAPELITAAQAAFDRGADAVQAQYEATDPAAHGADAPPRLLLARLAFFAFNVVRPRGRHALGLSAGLFGNGFGLAARTLRERPWRAHSIVEDLEYHLALVEAGRRVEFLPGVRVDAPLPHGAAGQRTQRTRWEGGRLAIALRHLPRLAARAFAAPRLVEPALDLALLPLGLHVLLPLPALVVGPPWARALAASVLAVLALHVAVAWALAGARRADLVALACAPLYVARKLVLLPASLAAARGNAPWRRTERDPHRGAPPAR